MNRAILGLIAVAGLASCGADEPLVAVMDQVEVEVEGRVEIDPLQNDLAPSNVVLEFDQDDSGMATLSEGGLLIRPELGAAGSSIEIPYTIRLGERSSSSVVIVNVPQTTVLPSVPPEVVPSEMTFGDADLDSEADVEVLPIFVSNLREDELESVVLVLESDQAFRLVGCPNSDDACVGGVSFRPPSPGRWRSTVAVELDDQVLGAVRLEGSATRSDEPVTLSFEVNPNPLNLGSRALGGVELSGLIKVTNDGNGPIAVGASRAEDADIGLRVVNACPVSLAPGSSCDVQVFVATNRVRSIASSVVVVADGVDSTEVEVNARIFESAPLPELTLSPNTLELDLANPTETVTVENTGEVPARGVTVAPAGLYAIADVNCAGTLEVGEQCTFDVSLTEDAVGVGGEVEVATVSVAVEGTDGFGLQVSADTTPPPPVASIEVVTGVVQFLDNNQPLNVTIRNNGDLAVEGLRIDPNGVNGLLGPFQITDAGSCAGSLAENATCSFMLQVDVAPADLVGGRSDQVLVFMGDASALIDVSFFVVR